MARYRKKPVVIEAVRFEDTDEGVSILAKFMSESNKDLRISYRDKDNPIVIIETLEGEMRASEGDFIIRGVKGEFYPCKPDIFHETYESADFKSKKDMTLEELIDYNNRRGGESLGEYNTLVEIREKIITIISAVKSKDKKEAYIEIVKRIADIALEGENR